MGASVELNGVMQESWGIKLASGGLMGSQSFVMGVRERHWDNMSVLRVMRVSWGIIGASWGCLGGHHGGDGGHRCVKRGSWVL